MEIHMSIYVHAVPSMYSNQEVRLCGCDYVIHLYEHTLCSIAGHSTLPMYTVDASMETRDH